MDKENGWPVPLVELRTTHHARMVSDNAGIIVFDLPELMGRKTWFDVHGHGYEAKKDGFGMRGVALTPEPGKTLKIEVDRTIIAKRLGRITGAGIFAESQRLGLEKDWRETGVIGCDSVQNAVFGKRMFWVWGDTTLAKYPLGIFQATGARSDVQPLKSFEPPVRLPLEVFSGEKGEPRGVSKVPGAGPTWLTGLITLPDSTGAERMVASYMKIKPLMEIYQWGLCEWNPKTEHFEPLKVLWTKSDEAPKPPPVPEGHPVLWKDETGKSWALFGNPLPRLRCPATFEAWHDPATWEVMKPHKTMPTVDGGKVTPHTGSIAWNGYRKRWVTVFMEQFGKPSAFGELWYAEADAPTGPWGPAIKVLSHDNYTFYNPRLHPEFTPTDSPILLFEGTYTQQFANRPEATPRYDYNQILYRLDLDDKRLAGAMTKP